MTDDEMSKALDAIHAEAAALLAMSLPDDA